MATPSRVLVVISTIVIALVLLLASGVNASGDAPGPTDDYVVRSGDTLWDIAGQYTAEGRDVRDTVSAIRDLNRIDGSLIRPGQVVVVPVASPTG